MRLFLPTTLVCALAAAGAQASPPVDLFEESGVRIDAPDGDFFGAGDGPLVGLAGVGDLNGDTLADLAFGAPAAEGEPGGAVHVLLGRATFRQTPTYVLPRDDSFTIRGVSDARGHHVGSEIAGAGDVNGDGFDDLLVSDVSNPAFGDYHASAYLIFGRAAPRDVDLDELGDQGFAIRNVGQQPRVAGVGDLDKDGFDDIGFGSGIENVAVLYGSARPTDADATDLGDRGFRILRGEDFANIWDLEDAGDVNGDSWPDLVVGLPHSTATTFPSPEDVKGAAVIFGGPRRTEPVDVSNLGDGGFKMELGTLARNPAEDVAGLGDFNGDGLGDVAIATKGPSQYSNREPEAPPPAVYVVFGSDSHETVDLENLGSRGTRLLTGGEEGLYEAWVDAPGDVNRDGRPDVLIGVPSRDTRHDDDTGRAYVVFGGSSTDEVRLRKLRGPYDEKRGFMLRGLPWDETGHRVAAAGDMDGDGWVELAVLAMGCQGHRADTALGWPETEPEIFLPDFQSRSRRLGYATHGPDRLRADEGRYRIRGRGGDDHLIGDGAENCLYGDDWDDRVEGAGGDDMLFAGDGNDEVSGGDGSDSIFGGHGEDRLTGGEGVDEFQSGIGNDNVEAGPGNDQVEAKSGDDVIEGDAGEDYIRAGYGADRVSGGGGKDYVYGGSGDDFLTGGPGDDILNGAKGDDEFDAADGEHDIVICGRGTDVVKADQDDGVNDNCEQVTRV